MVMSFLRISLSKVACALDGKKNLVVLHWSLARDEGFKTQ